MNIDEKDYNIVIDKYASALQPNILQTIPFQSQHSVTFGNDKANIVVDLINEKITLNGDVFINRSHISSLTFKSALYNLFTSMTLNKKIIRYSLSFIILIGLYYIYNLH